MKPTKMQIATAVVTAAFGLSSTHLPLLVSEDVQYKLGPMAWKVHEARMYSGTEYILAPSLQNFKDTI